MSIVMKTDTNNIVLFDLDGTLSPARESINLNLMHPLKELSKIARIGIVTGSGFEYVLEQCKELWNSIGSVYPDMITLLPCNGTQMFDWENQNWANIHSVNMIDKLSQDIYNILAREIIALQSFLVSGQTDMPLTGEFISYRKSMINWCPIGRAANEKQRQKFIDIDSKTKIRNTYIKVLKSFCIKNNIQITCALGGQTSVDIYPNGWDKTYALNHFKDCNIYFVGDKCIDDGNDRTIYEAILPNAYITSGPSETIKIIKEKIIPNIMKH